MIDIETGRPMDVLSGRTSEPVTDWLREHPSARILCRDRATAYAKAGRQAASEAVHDYTGACRGMRLAAFSAAVRAQVGSTLV
jgi:transposase